MRDIPLIFLLLSIICCTSKERESNNGSEAIFKKGEKLAKLTNDQLGELSGLAASAGNPGLLWTINDSGNNAEVFLINLEIQIQQTYVLEGVENRDWEDIAVGPGPDPLKQYVYVGEIGDNEAIYPLKYIYRFEEPVWNGQPEKISITNFDTITFQLPDKRKDTEALLIDPATKDLFIVSKRETPVVLYQLSYPYSTHDTIAAKIVGSLPLTQIVAGDISANSRDVLMKNYNHIYYWSNSSNKSIVDLLKEMPQDIPYTIEPQGESIAWARDYSGFYTISEKNLGQDAFLYFYVRK